MVEYNRSSLRKHQKPAVLRCQNYSIDDVINYKREHAMLYVPFRKELDILDGNAFEKMLDDNKKAIMEIKQRYSAGVTVSELISACEVVGRSEANHTEEVEQPEERPSMVPTLVDMNDNSDSVPEEVTTKMQQKVVAATYPGVHRRDYVMPLSDFYASMRLLNEQKASLIREVIHRVTDRTTKPLQIFFTGPAGCGKTFTLCLIMDVYNRYCRNHTISYGDGQGNSVVNAYVACATTSKVAIALNGVTVHSAFKIVMTNRREEWGLTSSDLNTFRMLFRDMKCIIVDEVSMLSSDLLRHMDLREIRASKMTEPFGGFDVIFCGDLRQLPLVRASEIYKRPRSGGSVYSNSVLPWHRLSYFPLTEVVRQSFSGLLTKIGDGKELNGDEICVLTDHFVIREQAAIQCPMAVRLFFSKDVDVHNTMVAESCEYKHDSVAIHVVTGHRSRQKVREALARIRYLSRAESGNLPSVGTFCTKRPYMLLKNIDVTDSLVNGMVVTLLEV
nr:ATP-dependent DNA helicase PIF1-like [Rhipicephalus microplus]